ncbi:hypothetical protein HBH70_093450 [Parastagonospora nodorum]|nr:hypothetical protein HBH48_139310 [Parastagonospora nodorum]KAH4430480.1 hypothetical protein HBH93_154940 [Parastagonospora nodorum]KAH4493837.1 hypothetical protein HBH89_157510 [Parastagonospora nodorum]KAH4541815.1 hypothetical protein HBH85_117990 [Parastagonospora nodorum]KAH5139970.1 hypothetical protein HBH70_093450 [Parastagonospora nodorum]
MQARHITPRTPGSVVQTGPPDHLTTSDAAAARARIISAHSSALPEGMDELLSGAARMPEAVQWAKDLYKTIEGYVFTERFGKPSYIQKYLPGVMSTMACDVHRYGSPVVRESGPETAARLACQQACQDAITALELLWSETYNVC